MKKISGKYLLVPINEKAEVTKMTLSFDNGQNISLLVRLDPNNAKHYMKYPISYFNANNVDITIESPIDFNPVFSNDDSFDISVNRPRIHFTAPNGWINDPNGLIYHDGLYHLFYQHNPVDTRWNNMHWGHAISSDLFHWKHLKEALYPDMLGTMFSGSAIKKGHEEGFYVLYTVEGNPFSQHIAHTKDGINLTKLGEILPHIVDANRDPKVIYDEKHNQYIMTLYLTEDRYALFSSHDLLNWTLIQELRLENDSECPDFYPLYVNDNPNNQKWIFSGAADYYLIGDFDGKNFTPLTKVKKLSYGHGYASQTFSGTPTNEIIRITWNRYEVHGENFCGQMATPNKLKLVEDENGLHLSILPVEQIVSMYVDHPLVLEGKDIKQILNIAPYRLDIDLSKKSGNLFIELFGMKTQFDFDNKFMVCGDITAPIIDSTSYQLIAIFDRQGMEWYLFDGQEYVIGGSVINTDTPYLSIKSDNEIKISIQQLKDTYQQK